jgi:hypothetical protein
MTRLVRLVTLTAASITLASVASAWRPAAVAAADPVTFGTPTATSSYGESIEFKQPIEFSIGENKVELLLRTQGSDAPLVTEHPPMGRGPATLEYTVALSDGHIVPNTAFTAQWRVTDADGGVWLSPAISETYSDDRVDWQTLEGDVVRVHWYEGDEAFGRRALQIGDDAVAEVSELLGVTESEPIDFFIYADQDQFYEALGPATRENVGGEAHADIRTMFALITPSEIDDDWVDIVVPHELTHLVFDTATENPYHEAPHWLNEGVAVYLSEGYKSSDRALVEESARNATIIPLEGLVGAFPTTRDRFFLAYAESVSAVDDIVADHGRDALVGLIRSYADGVSDDEAFSAALGMDMAAFEQSWLEGLGATAPVRHGPQPAPVGPLPEGWSGTAPNGTIQPGEQPGSSGGTNSPIEQPTQSGGLGPVVAVGVGLLVVGIAAVAFVAMRRSRRPPVVASMTDTPGASSVGDRPVEPANPVAWSAPGDERTAGQTSFTLPAPDENDAPSSDALSTDASEEPRPPATPEP